jgi:hypothetical protein
MNSTVKFKENMQQKSESLLRKRKCVDKKLKGKRLQIKRPSWLSKRGLKLLTRKKSLQRNWLNRKSFDFKKSNSEKKKLKRNIKYF